MSNSIASRLLICGAQLLLTELLLVAPGIYDRTLSAESILAPISLVTLAPIWALQDREYAALVAILIIDIGFISIMVFSITRNHKIIAAACLFVFNFMGIGFIAAGY
jgi:hypothetical protein